MLSLSSSALHAAWREEEHRYSTGGIPSYAYSKDLQISSAAEGTVQSQMRILVEKIPPRPTYCFLRLGIAKADPKEAC